MTPRSCSAIIVTLTLLATVTALGCSRVQPATTNGTTPTGLHVVAAGSPELRRASQVADQWRIFTKSDTAADTAAKRGGLLRIEVRDNGSTASELMTMTRSQPPSTTFADTVIMRRAGLTPMHERLVTRGRLMEIEYFGDSVYSRRYRNDTLVSTKAKRYAHAPFGFNQLETVLTSLPLRAGYQVLLPLYSEGDDSVEVDTVSVTGLITDGRPRWRVRFGDAVVVVHYMIDTATHRLTGIEKASARATPARWTYTVAEP